MNRALRSLLVSAAVLLSGTVAFAVVAAITPPGVDGVAVVVTDRPVLSVAAASTLLPAAPVTASAAPVSRADKPVRALDAPSVKNKTVVTGVISGSEPKIIVVPAVKPKPPTVNVETDPDHEVVTPPVRDEDDDEHDDDEHPGDSSSPSSDFDANHSEDTTRDSGYKGD